MAVALARARGSARRAHTRSPRTDATWYLCAANPPPHAQVLAARRLERLQDLQRRLLALYPAICAHVCELDVRSPKSVGEAVAGLPAAVASIDILINNAGLAVGMESLADSSPDAMDAMIDTNVKGLLLVTKAVLPGMLERAAAATVINVGSIAGVQTYPRGAVYCATKHAVHAITQALRMELVGTKIRVAEIMPGRAAASAAPDRRPGGDRVLPRPVRRRRRSRRADVRGAAGPVRRGHWYVRPRPPANVLAEMVVFVASRPEHVQVAELVCMPTNQASVHHIHRTL